jgi:hypothetical protein
MIRGWLQLPPSDTMIAAAPEGTPPRRIGEQNSKQLPAVLRRGPETGVYRMEMIFMVRV